MHTHTRTHTWLLVKKSVGNLTVAYHFRFRQAPHDAVSTGQKKSETEDEQDEELKNRATF